MVFLVACLSMAILLTSAAQAATRQVVGSFGTGTSGSADGQFNSPVAVAVHQATGDVYIADRGNHRVQRFDAEGGFLSKFGSFGTDGGQFNLPVGVAVDQSPGGSLYVSEINNRRVQKLGGMGAFALMWGWGVDDGTSVFQVCTVATTPCATGIAGAENGQFGASFQGRTAVDPVSDDVWVADPANRRVQRFTSAGVFVTKEGVAGTGSGEFGTNSPVDVAVDSQGDLYALDPGNNRVQKRDATTGTWSDFGGAEVTGRTATAIAVDPATDHLFVARNNGASTEKEIAELTSAGALVDVHGQGDGLVLELGATNQGLAVNSATEQIYLSYRLQQRVYVLDVPPPPPTVTIEPVTVVTATGATFRGTVNPNGAPTTYDFEYSSDGGATWTSAGGGSAGSGTIDVSVNKVVDGLLPGTEYRGRLLATNSSGTATSSEEIFTTVAIPPTISRMGASPATTTATIRGRINPNNATTTYRFEYGTDQSYGNVVPVRDIGSGIATVKVSEDVTGLQPGTTYHFKLVAENGAGVTESPDKTFTTLPAVPAQPPARAYEMVSPVDKGNVDLVHGAAGKASTSGNGFAFWTRGGFPGALSSSLNMYLASRGSTAWSTKSLSPKISEGNSSFAIFDDDLSRALMQSKDMPDLVPGEPLGNRDLYLRDNAADTYELVTTQPPAEVTLAAPVPTSASANLDRVLFNFETPLEYFQGGPDSAAYYATGGSVSIASVLPDGSVPSNAGAGAGTSASSVGHVGEMSDDGSRIFFSVPGTTGSQPAGGAQLYVRKDHGTPGADTVQLSAPEPGVSDPNGTRSAFFRAASADGSKAFFTSCQRLTADSTADATGVFGNFCFENESKADLYLFDLEADGGSGDLIDLTTADASGADVRGLVGASEDGTRAYFVAMGALDTGALAGRPNLYLWEQGNGVTHIATLESGDADIWNVDSSGPERDARVTPDGRFVAFASSADLDPNHDNGGHQQVYLYDVEADAIVCASCVGPGPAAADATIRNQRLDGGGYTAAFEKRNLLDDGSRLFFETAEGMVDDDTNNQIDVYEYDTAMGTLALVSRGRGQFASIFASASPSGADVFFTTREQLVGWDRDDLIDIYDARVGGGFPEPESSGDDCGLDCQGSPGGRPDLHDPGSGLYRGPGDLALGPRTGGFSIRKLTKKQRARLARGRRVTFVVGVPRSGRVSLLARANIGGQSRTVGRAGDRAGGKGQVRLALRLSPLARAQLARGRRLRVILVVRFGDRRKRLVLSLSRGRAR